MESIIFYAFAGMVVLFSLFVVFFRNPVLSALSLVVSFFCVSAIFVLLHAPFLGVIQILIYAGAILVLFLYVVMLLNLRKEEPSKIDKRLFWIALALFPTLSTSLFQWIDPPGANATIAPEFGSIKNVGEHLLGPSVLIFELLSVALLIAIIGVVVLSLLHKKEQQ